MGVIDFEKIQHQSDWSIQSTCGVFTPMTLCFVCEHRWAQMIFLQFNNTPIWVSKYFLVPRDTFMDFCSGRSHPLSALPMSLTRAPRAPRGVFCSPFLLSLESQQKLQRQNRCGISRVRVVCGVLGKGSYFSPSIGIQKCWGSFLKAVCWLNDCIEMVVSSSFFWEALQFEIGESGKNGLC